MKPFKLPKGLRQASALSNASGPRVAFVFGGENSFLQMGRSLFESSAIFRQAMEECDAMFRKYTSVRLLKAMYEPKQKGYGSTTVDHEFDNSDDAHAAMFSLQYALAKVLMEELGVQPQAVMGYSNGEIAAAVISGVMTLEDVCKLFATAEYRHFDKGVGGMAVVGDISWQELQTQIIEVGDPLVVISAIYSETSYMVSGAMASVQETVPALHPKPCIPPIPLA